MTIIICRVKDKLLKILQNYLYSTNIFLLMIYGKGLTNHVYCC